MMSYFKNSCWLISLTMQSYCPSCMFWLINCSINLYLKNLQWKLYFCVTSILHVCTFYDGEACLKCFLGHLLNLLTLFLKTCMARFLGLLVWYIIVDIHTFTSMETSSSNLYYRHDLCHIPCCSFWIPLIDNIERL